MSRKQQAEKRGRLAELQAAWALRFKGYKILENRYKSPVGEIDLIAKKGDMLVAVEVKYRAELDIAHQSIAYKQRRRIEKAIAVYAANINHSGPIRFDAMLKAKDHFFVKHIKGAWRSGE